MHVISRKTLSDYWQKVPEAEQLLKAWFCEAQKARWTSPADIKEKYRSASFLKGNRVVFNICGNKHRLIVRINYASKTVFVRFVGTHSEYDKINAGSVMSYNKLIKTEVDYNNALKRIEQLFDAEEGTPEADELELLATLVELYEKEHFPIDAPDPVSAIKFRMEQEGLTNEDMIAYLGGKSRVSEIFSHKRNLSLSMIRKLVTGLQIPAEVLLGAAVL